MAHSGRNDTDLESVDPVVEACKRHVDRSLLRRNLRKTVAERVAALIALQRLAEEARRAGGLETIATLEALREES